MTTDQVRRGGEGAARAGTQALSLLSIPINAAVMQGLAAEPRPLAELRREAGSPPQTTMRGHLRTLTATGILERRRTNDFPGNVEYQLSASGRELLAVAEVLAGWLGAHPEGPTTLGTAAAKGAIRALVEGWTTNMVRALAARPLTLTELDLVITAVSYPSLERRLCSMRLAGLVTATAADGRGKPHTVTEWLCQAIAPLAAGARWEQRRLGDEAPVITNRDTESAFLLALSLLKPPPELEGSCRLGVQMAAARGASLAGVVVAVAEGRVASQVTRLEGDVDAWALGSSAAWFAALIEGDLAGLEVGGAADLAVALIDGLHGALFALAPTP